MFQTITCVHCGTRQTALIRITPGRKIRCRSCGLSLPPAALEDLLRMQGLMRRGDDEGGGGGDWGGGGGESAEAEGGDEDEDDGKGGKKKKKKAKSGGLAGGIFASLMGKLIGMVVGVVVLLSCCCVIGIVAMFGTAQPPFLGEYEGAYMKKEMVEVENDKGEKVKKEEDVEVLVKLKIDKTDDKTGTGVYTIEGEPAVSYKFKWKDWDKDKKSVVFEMDNKEDTFWKDIKSPATFTYDSGLNKLTLVSGGVSMDFTTVKKDTPPRTKAPAGGGKKRKK